MAEKNISRKHVVARLMTSAVYIDEGPYWNILTEEENTIQSTIEEMGLKLVVDHEMGMGYLRPLDQAEEEEVSVAGYAPIPKVIPTKTLGYHTSVLCALLRQALQQHEDNTIDTKHLYLEEAQIIDMIHPFMPEISDQKKRDREVGKLINRLEEIGVLHKLANRTEGIYRVEPIIRARISIDALQALLARLVDHNKGKPDAEAESGTEEPSTEKAT
jgi:hypothetical protein